MTNSISPVSKVEYEKDDRIWSVSVKPHTVFIAPSINDGYYMLTAVSLNGSYTLEVSYTGKATPNSIYLGKNDYREVRLSKGMRISGKTTIHSHVFIRDIPGRFSSVDAEIEVVIQDFTKVYIVDNPQDMRSTRI